jgi:ABC-type antimicrobial peptide transport system permease subunit
MRPLFYTRRSACSQILLSNSSLFKVQTLDERLRLTVNVQGAVAALLGVFAGLTLLLAAIGIYRVASHVVSLRTREVGIRMSLARARRTCFGCSCVRVSRSH